MAEVIHSAKSDSPGYTKYYFDEPVGTTQGGLRATGPKMKFYEPRTVADENNNMVMKDEAEYEIIFHGQVSVDLPNEVKELKFEDGSTLKLSSGS